MYVNGTIDGPASNDFTPIFIVTAPASIEQGYQRQFVYSPGRLLRRRHFIGRSVSDGTKNYMFGGFGISSAVAEAAHIHMYNSQPAT